MKQVLKTIESLFLKSKYQLVILFSATAMFLSSCQKEELQSSSQKAELQGISQKQDLLSTSQQQNLLTGLQKQNIIKKTIYLKASFVETENIIREPQPGITLLNHIIGTGEGTHIGRSTLDGIVEVDVFAPPPLHATGTITITAANGDQIIMSNSAVITGTDANGINTVILNETITGGTGRFAGASGTLTGIAHDSDTSPNASGSFEGYITY